MLLLSSDLHTKDASKVRRYTASTKTLFTRAREVETKYASQLKKIASHVGHIIRGFPPGDRSALPELTNTLGRYAEIIRPWARHTSERILLEVSHWDEQAWYRHVKEMSASLAEEVRSADVGTIFRALQDEQVTLITSIPIEAAERVHKLVEQTLTDSSRAAEYIEAIKRSGHVARSRATLIARTEIGRATTNFTQARAEHIGSPGYYWQTVGDGRVRQEHKKLNGTFHRWNDPPIAGTKGMRYHPGAGPNCRCWPRPIFNPD